VAQFHSGVDLRGQFKLNFPNKRNFVPLNSLAMQKTIDNASELAFASQ